MKQPKFNRSGSERQLVDQLTPPALAWWNGAAREIRYEVYDIAADQGIEAAVAFVESMAEPEADV